MWDNWNFHAILVKIQNGGAILENNLAISYEVKIYLLHNPEIPLWGIYPREFKIYVQILVCKCPWWLYSLLRKTGNNPNVLHIDKQNVGFHM